MRRFSSGQSEGVVKVKESLPLINSRESTTTNTRYHVLYSHPLFVYFTEVTKNDGTKVKMFFFQTSPFLLL